MYNIMYNIVSQWVAKKESQEDQPKLEHTAFGKL